MQIIVTDKDFYKSASCLNRKNLQSQIFEAIHILACNLGIEDKLVNPIFGKRAKSIKNHPVSKLWKGFEAELLYYIHCHICEWKNREYKIDINQKNYDLLYSFCLSNRYYKDSWNCKIPISNDFIQMHRSNLIRKEIVKHNKYLEKYFVYTNGLDEEYNEKFYHYRSLWPNCPADIPMRYDWRNNV